MYSGITKGLYEIIALNQVRGILSYTVRLPLQLVERLAVGDSIAVDGVCQTVVAMDKHAVSFQAIEETLKKTTLGELALGSMVSIERSLRVGDEIGGHEVSGHVFGTALIAERIKHEDNLSLIIKCDPQWMKYILPKGFIAVDGSSLTVGETVPEQGLFYLHLIPETVKLTNFAAKPVGGRVNIEFDHKTRTIVDTVERVLAAKGLRYRPV